MFNNNVTNGTYQHFNFSSHPQNLIWHPQIYTILRYLVALRHSAHVLDRIHVRIWTYGLCRRASMTLSWFFYSPITQIVMGRRVWHFASVLVIFTTFVIQQLSALDNMPTRYCPSAGHSTGAKTSSYPLLVPGSNHARYLLESGDGMCWIISQGNAYVRILATVQGIFTFVGCFGLRFCGEMFLQTLLVVLL